MVESCNSFLHARCNIIYVPVGFDTPIIPCCFMMHHCYYYYYYSCCCRCCRVIRNRSFIPSLCIMRIHNRRRRCQQNNHHCSIGWMCLSWWSASSHRNKNISRSMMIGTVDVVVTVLLGYPFANLLSDVTYLSYFCRND
jgi:hypothetical protein